MEFCLEKKLQGFKLIAQEKLQAIICTIPGKKDLIIEEALIKPLEHVFSASWLKLKGIQHIYKLDITQCLQRHDQQIQIFMIYNTQAIFDCVLKHIRENESKQATETDAAVKYFHIICIPNCFSYFPSQLEEEGLYGLVQLHRFNWDFIQLDQGVLSMEISSLYSRVFLHDDTSLLPVVAHSLRVMQMVCGRPELILSFGEHAGNVVKMINALGPYCKDNENRNNTSSDFSAIIIIDRDKDYPSSLLTPAIYAGLLLEVFGQTAGEINLSTNKILSQKLEIFQQLENRVNSKHSDKSAKQNPTTKDVFIRLNSANDEIFGENRYKHFAQASSLIRAQAKAIGLEVQKLNDMKLDEMQDYVARKLPKITELKAKVTRHLNASEKVIEMLAGNFQKLQSLEEDILNNISRKRIFSNILELLTTDAQKYNTLRLLCLLHVCTGVSNDEMIQFTRNYCNSFGLQHVQALYKLAKGGLLPHINEEEKINKSVKLLSQLPIPKFQQTEFQANANRLKLFVSTARVEDNHDNSINSGKKNSNTACPSYIFNSLYIPLVAQLCTLLLKSTNVDDFAAKISTVEKIQMHLLSQSSFTAVNSKTVGSYLKQPDKKDIFPLRQRNLLVYIIGGVTYAEIAACNMVEQLNGAKIIVASDSIISGSDLIKGAFQ